MGEKNVRAEAYRDGRKSIGDDFVAYTTWLRENCVAETTLVWRFKPKSKYYRAGWHSDTEVFLIYKKEALYV